jgi:hypothetical protein
LLLREHWIFHHADSFWTAEAPGGRALVINRWSFLALCVLPLPKRTQVTQKPLFATAEKANHGNHDNHANRKRLPIFSCGGKEKSEPGFQ